MIPLYDLETKIYQFSINFLQFEQIVVFKSIDRCSDVQDPYVEMMWIGGDGGLKVVGPTRER
jgi:hypothetical protein